MESQNKASSPSINVDEYSSLTSNNENPQNTATLTNLTPDQISALNAHLPNEINIETITSTLTTNNENEVNPLVPSSISNTLDTLTFYQLILIIISIVNFCRKKSQTYNKNFEEKFNLASVQSSNATQQDINFVVRLVSLYRTGYGGQQQVSLSTQRLMFNAMGRAPTQEASAYHKLG
ncbi:hypothetical protein PFDG_02145 [Plasmodium falciparum Dd2]|uniref:Uncharacterized protein n=1 Tax=Plasmodium falciparum (isolate Dd2) TaxID=57267 RepID=A0A0L7M1V4_PLAF4|nr:hypothetical protein PFDG_02145 [Plasmodium falciparum Dd2]